MAARKRQYSREFKLEAVRLVQQSDEPVAQIARRLGIRRDILNRWRREVERGKHDLDAEVKDAAEGPEVERLRRELERVKQERDFLKKAAAYFARESK